MTDEQGVTYSIKELVGELRQTFSADRANVSAGLARIEAKLDNKADKDHVNEVERGVGQIQLHLAAQGDVRSDLNAVVMDVNALMAVKQDRHWRTTLTVALAAGLLSGIGVFVLDVVFFRHP